MQSDPTYPAHWEADVVLSDGATAHVRPIQPGDAELLVDFYSRVSDESKYFRFFAPYPRLSERDVDRFTRVDHDQRVALIMTVGDAMIAVARYDRITTGEAEVSFLVEDGHQGRGVATILLEHLAQAARERGVYRFVADVLPDNRKMIGVFAEAGYSVDDRFEDGVVHVEFEILPTDHSLRVMTAREHRAEARSIERLLTPGSVAVVGASRTAGKAGQELIRNIQAGGTGDGFSGAIYAVHPEASSVCGVPAYPSVRDIPGDVDLAVLAVPARAVNEVVSDCAAKGVHALVVVAEGFAERGDEEGRERQAELVRAARANGMRVVGPNCLGIVNTDPAYRLNASLAGVLPPPGRVGLFAQSGALGTAILGDAAARGLGLSTFVSAGNRADVSGNDLLQYWRDDPATEVVLLYLESLGNPRKFSRISRRVAEVKPVVVVKSGRTTQSVPLGHAVRPIGVPQAALDAMFQQSGVIQVETVSEMLDAGQVLAYQPPPAGGRVGVVGNSSALCLLANDAVVAAGLDLGREPVDLGSAASAEAYAEALADLRDDPGVDSLLVLFAPAVESSSTEDVARVLAGVSASGAKPIVTTFLGSRGVPEAMRSLDEQGVPQRGSVPSYPSVEEAVRALTHATWHARWQRRRHGQVPELANVRSNAARERAERFLGGGASVELTHAQVTELVAEYGIDLLPMAPARTLDEAIAAMERFGTEVVLKATAMHLRHRPDLADVWRNIDTEGELRDAWETMSQTLANPAEAAFVVQPMAPGGVPVGVWAREDAMFGPVLSFGVSGLATELLDDRAYRIPPLTDVDAAEMVRAVKAAPLLFGYRGGMMVDVTAVEDLLHRVSRMSDDLPELELLELDPVLVGEQGLSVVNATARLARPALRSDWYARRL
ncbi:GNAT family N-acetyltransferase [Actinobacteria bacterium YIM 96077]|uniref:GNAT family N-acetyltransferase n=1 Tax=Phytoactinopolyspora halophila TaxID=1981511 RepID=A0A329QJF2_9ACTN|nr:GNAT family N-acetyltransferase [Phytoactinopolyspora halophila]AYY13505.1 GNAT family N-acetyltransferase [Actinobacteria bacterium YIM 96077]RAW12440.1 GNAT family N-acetyltransferase [Phytoactinopolyspora halophila]